MPIYVWTKSSNPATDPPDFNWPRETAEQFLSRDQARRLPNRHGKLSNSKIQLTVAHRKDGEIRPTGHRYANAALIEGGTVWRVVHQTARDGVGPGEPNWQMRP